MVEVMRPVSRIHSQEICRHNHRSNSVNKRFSLPQIYLSISHRIRKLLDHLVQPTNSAQVRTCQPCSTFVRIRFYANQSTILHIWIMNLGDFKVLRGFVPCPFPYCSAPQF